MPRGNVAFGDRQKARQPCLRCKQIIAVRVELALGSEITDREQLAIIIEQKCILHFERYHPRIASQCGQTCSGIRRFCLFLITAVASDCVPNGVGPEYEIAVSVLAAFDREGSRHVRDGVSSYCKLRKPFGDVHAIGYRLPQIDSQLRDGFLKLSPRHRLRARSVAHAGGFFSRQLKRVGDTCKSTGVIQWSLGPLLARGRQREEVSGQISAIDRRNVGRIERPQVLCVVPIVEVAAEPR